MPTKVFWVEPTDQQRVELRRYRRAQYNAAGEYVPEPCPAENGQRSYHDVRVQLSPEEAAVERLANNLNIPHSDPHWPQLCKCGYCFQETDHWQVAVDTLWTGAPDGKLYTLREAPPGAMWDADWYRAGGAREWCTGPDGLCLVVRLPNHSDWMVDVECSNCTRPQSEVTTDANGNTIKRWTGRTHYCWVRSGDPRTGNLHVDKNGNTCSAGAGSVISGNYHGFLHNGYLTDSM